MISVYQMLAGGNCGPVRARVIRTIRTPYARARERGLIKAWEASFVARHKGTASSGAVFPFNLHILSHGSPPSICNWYVRGQIAHQTGRANLSGYVPASCLPNKFRTHHWTLSNFCTSCLILWLLGACRSWRHTSIRSMQLSVRKLLGTLR